MFTVRVWIIARFRAGTVLERGCIWLSDLSLSFLGRFGMVRACKQVETELEREGSENMRLYTAYYPDRTEVKSDPVTEARRTQVTKRVQLRLAELKIDSYGLDCTPDEYIAECKRRHKV